MNKKQFALIALASAAILGCASMAEADKSAQKTDEGQFLAENGKANVFFVRVDTTWLRKYPIDVHIDNRKIATLMQKDYTQVSLEPGNHIINLYGHDGNLLYVSQMQANKNYYFQIDETNRGSKFEPSIGIILFDFDAKSTIKRSHRVEPSR